MKLRFCTSIYEADNAINRGYRLKQVAKIQEAIKKDLDNAGFKCEVNSDQYLSILPEFDYLVRIQVESSTRQDRNDSPSYTLKISGLHGLNEAPLAGDKENIDSKQLLNDSSEIAKSVVSYLQLFKLDEAYLTEAPFVGNMADRIVAKMKQAKTAVTDKIANAKAEKDAKSNAADLLQEISKRMSSDLASAFSSANITTNPVSIQIVPQISGTVLTIDVKGFVARIIWGIDPNKPNGSTLIASALATPLSVYKVPSDKLDDGLKIILKKLEKITEANFSETRSALKIADDENAEAGDESENASDENSNESSENAESDNDTAGDAYEQQLKKSLGNLADILMSESLTESTRESKLGSYAKYQQAFEAADATTLPALVNYFLYKELGLKDSQINPRLLKAINKSIKEEGISPAFNNRLGAFLTYYDVQNSLPDPWFIDTVKELSIDRIVDLKNGTSLLDAIDGNLALIYTKEFWDYSTLIDDLETLYNSFYNRFITKDNLAKVIEKQQNADKTEGGDDTQLKKMLGNNFTVNPDELRKNILLKSPTAFRPLNEITKLVQAAQKDSGYSGYFDDVDTAGSGNKKAVTSFKPEEFEELKSVINNSDDKTVIKNIASAMVKYQKALDLANKDKVKSLKKAFFDLIKLEQAQQNAAEADTDNA